MWIRSQDKMTLKECDEFSLGTSNGKACIYGVKGNWESGESIPPILGEYETKERALEILDKMQNQITSICRVSNREPDSYEGWLRTEYLDVCFEMPEK
jgi:hypothetical protein